MRSFITKYRPTTLDELSFNHQAVKLAKSLVQYDNLNVIFTGFDGCGKTTMLEKVICHTYESFFESTARATPSNKSARLFKAKTVHSLNGFKPSDSLRTVNIHIRTDVPKFKCPN